MGKWFNRAATSPADELLAIYREKVKTLEAENRRLQLALETEKLRIPEADAVDGVGQLPDEIEDAIRSRFSYSPIASGLTRAAVRDMMRTSRNIDALQVLDNLGEQA
ncbi:MAG: hypothetical protein IPK85_03275 [Gemmatimonadetes bacterium]|nr:hypothetical protein [Gemmatimonadota bacterium]